MRNHSTFNPPQPESLRSRDAPVQAQPTTDTHVGEAALAVPSCVQCGDAEGASPQDVVRLQRLAGNGAVSRFLSPSSRPLSARRGMSSVQAKLMVGPSGDRYEREADRVAERVLSMPEPARGSRDVSRGGAGALQRQEGDEEEPVQAMPLASTITPLVQRQDDDDDDEELKGEGEVQAKPLAQRADAEEEEVQTQRPSRQAGGGFGASRSFEHQLAASRGSGSPLPSELRSYMEPRFGASFGGVRLHTGAEAAQLNREIHARAFTHGQDIYVGEGGYDPASSAGKQLLAHELTHVVQQTGAGRSVQASSLVQRARYIPNPPKGHTGWYSDGRDPKQELTKDNGVITVTAGGGGFGHTWVYLEWLDPVTSKGRTCMCELRVGGITASGSEVKDPRAAGLSVLGGAAAGPSASVGGKGLVISIIRNAKALALRSASIKRSWVRTRAQIMNALHKAIFIRIRIKDYIYMVAGRGWFTLKKPINCARFGEKLLKAAGVSASEASSGFIWKTPYQLATGERRFTKPKKK